MNDDKPMTTEIALLRALRIMHHTVAQEVLADPRDIDAILHIHAMLDQRGMGELEPGCDYLHRAIDVWMYG